MNHIRRIEVIPVELPMTKPVKMAFEEVRSTENALVRLETKDGVVGWGDAPSAPTMTGETLESMVAAVRYLSPRLEGMPADEIEAVMSRADQYLFGNLAAKSAIEMALHDALGRATGRPIYELLGGKRRASIPILRQLASGCAATDVEEALRRKAEGFVTFKIKVGLSDALDDARRTREVSEALDDRRILLCADANQGWSVEQASAYVKAVEDTSLEFLEQPVPGANITGMAAVAAASRVKLCCDEGLHTIDDLRRHHAAGAAHGANLKTIKLGGIKRLYDAALVCEELRMHVNLACKMAGCGITCAALIQLAASIPAVDWGMSLTVQYLADDVLATPLSFTNGHADVPSGPGLGIEVDEAKVRRYARAL